MNAGFVSSDHWVQDLETGGGRIIGEACHYIDLISFITGSEVTAVVMNAMGLSPKLNTDNASILLKYANGSTGVINYFSNGNKGYSKERIEIYDQEKNIIIDNFRKISFYGYNKKNKKITQNKGHKQQFLEWYKMVSENCSIVIPVKSLFNTSRAAIYCLKSLRENKWIF